MKPWRTGKAGSRQGRVQMEPQSAECERRLVAAVFWLKRVSTCWMDGSRPLHYDAIRENSVCPPDSERKARPRSITHGLPFRVTTPPTHLFVFSSLPPVPTLQQHPSTSTTHTPRLVLDPWPYQVRRCPDKKKRKLAGLARFT